MIVQVIGLAGVSVQGDSAAESSSGASTRDLVMDAG